MEYSVVSDSRANGFLDGVFDGLGLRPHSTVEWIAKASRP
jgi:hypothetical protein